MANLQSNIEYLSNKIRDTFKNRPGQSSKTPDADSTIEPLNANQTASSNSKNINNPGTESYSPAENENYVHNYDNQQHNNQELNSTNYELPADNQNYQGYSMHDQNYPAEYANQNYGQYDQYDPSLYENQSNVEGEQNQGQISERTYNDENNQQNYENYSNEGYVSDQQQQLPQEQQYVESNPNQNVS
ncbi:hypothetical protein PV325_006519 [Microctonus aethiopoides]|nr:hypothetical protein PV325_006519 [Microctonus aethiopoides]KAK0098972.1 hypothetical protein PV326_011996 [Microctonus aethiopoides]